jgi:hypothetical protein
MIMRGIILNLFNDDQLKMIWKVVVTQLVYHTTLLKWTSLMITHLL